MLENLLQLFTSVIGFIATFLILFRYKSNRIANIYLVLLILLISFQYLITGTNLFYDFNFIINLLSDYQNIKMLIYPLTYLYFKNLIGNVKKVRIFDLKHFFVLFLLFLVDSIIADLPIYSSKTVYYLYVLFYFSYTIYYIVLIGIILKKNIWGKNDMIIVWGVQNKLLKNWSIYLATYIVLISVRNIILIVLLFFSYSPIDDYMWFSILLTTLIFLKILISPEILYGYEFMVNKIENDKKAVILNNTFWIIEPKQKIVNLQDLILKPKVEEKLFYYINLIDNLTNEESVFRNPDFSMGDFAKHLNISKSHLAYLFKYHSSISFPDFKKRIRIHDSLKLIEAGFLKKHTLFTLAKTVGFFTYSPFFISFKEITGFNPLEYSKKND